MKIIDIISATPELLKSPFSGSIMSRAIEKGIVQVNIHDLKDFSNNKKKQIDPCDYDLRTCNRSNSCRSNKIRRI